MERFNYPSLKALRKESAQLLRMLEVESYGYKADEKEELEEMKRQQEMQQQELRMMTEDYHYG